MDKIQDRAVKFLNDVRKKKIAVESKTERNNCRKEPVKNVYIHSEHISSNNCFYCQKVFISPKFLLKHILRRHPEDLLQLHKKCLKTESNNNSIDSHNVLKFLQDEFLKLREDLIAAKQCNEVTQKDNIESNKGKSYVHEKYKSQHHASTMSRDYKSGDCHYVNDSGSNELQIIKEKVTDLESNIQCLCNKFEELDTLVKDKILSEQDIHNLITANENKILKAQEIQLLELRGTLHDKLQNMLSNQLHQNSIELQSQLSELKEEIARLNHLIDLIGKKINSPELLTDLEKKFKDNIISFLGRGDNIKGGVPKTRCSKFRKKSNLPGHSGSLLENKVIPVKKSENYIVSVNAPENVARNSISHSIKMNTFEVTRLLAEKMSSLGIDPNTSKMSSEDYKEKKKLIEIEKKKLLERSGNFSKTYNKIKLLVDDRLNNRLQQKKYRKLRFSEPLISSKNNHKSKVKKVHNITYPYVESDSFTFSDPSKSVYLKSDQKEIQNISSSSDYNIHKFVTNIGKSDKCFQNFMETPGSKSELQSTPFKDHESTKIAYKMDSQAVGIKNLSTKCFSNSKHFELDEKISSLAQESESSSYTLEDYNMPGKCIVHEPSRKFQDEKDLQDETSLDSLSEWEGDKDDC